MEVSGVMGVFATKSFARFSRKARLSDAALLSAARDVAGGRCHASLGGDVFKQRVARSGGGKSGGFRTIIVFRAGGHCFFVYGFAKNQQASVSAKALEALKRLAAELTSYSAAQIVEAVVDGEMLEIEDHGQERQEDDTQGD